jgi:serine/threonine protein phosphatase PrpC
MCIPYDQSRAVLGCNDGVAVQLTEDHKASNKAEKIRIETAKGLS